MFADSLGTSSRPWTRQARIEQPAPVIAGSDELATTTDEANHLAEAILDSTYMDWRPFTLGTSVFPMQSRTQ